MRLTDDDDQRNDLRKRVMRPSTATPCKTMSGGVKTKAEIQTALGLSGVECLRVRRTPDAKRLVFG